MSTILPTFHDLYQPVIQDEHHPIKSFQQNHLSMIKLLQYNRLFF